MSMTELPERLPKRGARRTPGERGKVRKAMEWEVSQTDLAHLWGITVGAIGNLIARGAVTKQPNGRFTMNIATREIVKHYRSELDRRRGLQKKDAGGRARLTEAQADMAEMNRGVLSGELIPEDWVEKRYVDLAALFVQRLMSVPDTVAPQLVKYLKGAGTFEEVRSLLRDIVTVMAEEVSEMKIDYTEKPLRHRPSGRGAEEDDDEE
jgi:phage terminase Nu1 subunit (DNA packaging protein)